MHSALLIVDRPNPNNENKNWVTFITNSQNIIALNKEQHKSESTHAFADNVFLVPLKNELHVFTALTQRARDLGFNTRVTFFDAYPSFVISQAGMI